MAEQSLKDKTVKGTFWSGIDNVTQFGVTFVVSIVLARLLSPDDYGLIGIITIFTAICDALIDGGFSTALIRKKNATDGDYNTTFIINLTMSVALYVVIFFCSPLIAKFFNRQELIDLTRATSFGMIISAFALVHRTQLTKRIDFKTQTKITAIASIASGAIGIAMAFLGYGVWALVAQNLTGRVIRAILFWIYNKWIPKLFFSKQSFHELFGFGWKMMLSGLLNTIWMDLYQVVIGRFYKPSTLGQYTRAKNFSTLLSSNLTRVVQRVTYPVLSTIQDDKERMVSAYRRIIGITMFVTAISMFFLGAISEPFIYCLIGPKWHEASDYLPLICISGSLYPLHAINLNMLQVQGRSDLFLGLEIVKKIIGVLPLAACIFYGILAMLYVNIVVGIICFFLNSHYSGKMIGYSSWMQMKDVAPSFAIAIVVALSVFFLKYLPMTEWVILPIQIVIGVLVFLCLCKIMHIKEFEECKKIGDPVMNKIVCNFKNYINNR